MPPTMEEMASGERVLINRAIATARSAVDGVGDDATDAEVTAAENALSALKAAIDAASNVPEHERDAHTTTHGVIAGDLTAAKMSREMAMEAAKQAAEQEEEMMKMVMAEETRATARKLFHAMERDREFDEEQPLRLTKSVKGPILVRSDLTFDANSGLDPDGGGDERFPSSFTNRTNSIAPMDDDDIPVKELPELAGWRGGEYVYEHADCETTIFPNGCVEGITDHLVIYINEPAPEPADPQTFAQRYGDNDWYMTATPTRKAHITTDALNGDDWLANWPLIASDEFPTAGKKTHTKSSIRGTFDGAAGVYTCQGTGAEACTSTYEVGNSDSQTPAPGIEYIHLEGGGTNGWTFTPDNPNAMVTTADAMATRAHLWYGWWAREMSGDDGWFDVRPITSLGNSDLPHANGVAAAIKGSATYTGGAAGKYAIYHPVAGGSSAGAWTADAMLSADFDNQKVSGELTRFMVGDQAMDWKVELLESGDINGAAAPSARAVVRGGSGGFMLDGSSHGFSNVENGTVWTMGGMAGDKAGSWYGDFWAEESATLDSTAANNPAPASATGVFWAEHGDTARMTGAFGVTRDERN